MPSVSAFLFFLASHDVVQRIVAVHADAKLGPALCRPYTKARRFVQGKYGRGDFETLHPVGFGYNRIRYVNIITVKILILIIPTLDRDANVGIAIFSQRRNRAKSGSMVCSIESSPSQTRIGHWPVKQLACVSSTDRSWDAT